MAKKMEEEISEPISCLRKERVTVRFVPKETGMVTDKKHVLYGGMALNASRTFTVPRLSSGMLVNILTDSEKKFLEDYMGLEYNALSIYKKENNFWDGSNDRGISAVKLTKQDNFFNLENPEDYIRYKILLANKDYIAPSIRELKEHPKSTYQFVVISEGEENKVAKDEMSTTMKCYKEFGKVEEDIYTLRVIIETLEGKSTSANSKLEFLQTNINKLIQENSKKFLEVITDPLLPTKVLIKKCLEKHIIKAKGNYLYLSDNTPLCEDNQEPTMNVAARFLNLPKNQEIKFSLEAQLN